MITKLEMKQVFRELKKPEVKEFYKAVIVDTIDVAADRCKKYICQQNGIEDLTDLGFGKGWTKFKEEFNEVFRGLTQLGYAVFFIGHNKEVTVTDPVTKTDSIVIRSGLSNATREVITGMADIYAYAYEKVLNEPSKLMLRCSDGHVECGSRFKYLPNEINTDYNELVNAIQIAIDKEAAEHGNQFVTNEKKAVVEQVSYNYDALMEEFGSLVGDLMQKDGNYYGPRITQIIEKYLGKGRKIADTTIDQAEFIHLINMDIKDELILNQ